MDLVAYWFGFALCVAAAVVLMVHYKKRVKSGSISETRAKNLFSLLCFPTSLAVSIAAFIALVVALNAPLAHGEILISGPLSYLALAALLSALGRTIIGWRTTPW
jgi:hypothetical protein